MMIRNTQSDSKLCIFGSPIASGTTISMSDSSEQCAPDESLQTELFKTEHLDDI